MASHPEVPANEVRFKISGQSNIDKYEYGYGATLAVMAKMILGQESGASIRPVKLIILSSVIFLISGSLSIYKLISIGLFISSNTSYTLL